MKEGAQVIYLADRALCIRGNSFGLFREMLSRRVLSVENSDCQKTHSNAKN